MPDGYVYRVRVWWKDTVQDLLVKIADRVGHTVYKLEMWQTRLVEGKLKVELLPATAENYGCGVEYLPELQIMLKVKDWQNDVLNLGEEEEGEEGEGGE